MQVQGKEALLIKLIQIDRLNPNQETDNGQVISKHHAIDYE